MNYTQSIGNIVELKCITKFIELGYECSIPYGNGAKYDFIADINGELLRFQCKSSFNPKKKDGSIDTEAIQFYTVSQTTNTQKTVRHTYSKEQIDYFATCFNDKVYIIPVEECSTSKTLRFSPPKNNQQYNNAEDYEIFHFFSKNEELEKTEEEFKNRQTTDNEIKKYYCSQCGKEITMYSDSGLCNSCYRMTTRIVERPSREELKEMIRTMPFTTIGKNFNVSDNAVRKWCKAENLPSKSGEIKKYSDKEWEKI